MQRVPSLVVLGALAAALLLEGAVLYFLEDRSWRLGVGLGLLFPIAWMFSSTRVAEVISDLPRRVRRRRHPRMRAQVNHLLAEIRRLNGIAVDGDRGFRDREEAEAEMDASEERMRRLVGEIRREAGVVSHELDLVSDEPDPVPFPDQPSVSDEQAHE